jgi:hypothetical protein
VGIAPMRRRGQTAATGAGLPAGLTRVCYNAG